MMKMRHEIDESILIPKTKRAVAAVAIAAVVVAGGAAVQSTHDEGLKMRHDAYVIRHVDK